MRIALAIGEIEIQAVKGPDALSNPFGLSRWTISVRPQHKPRPDAVQENMASPVAKSDPVRAALSASAIGHAGQEVGVGLGLTHAVQ
jgi:hypothetical protein